LTGEGKGEGEKSRKFNELFIPLPSILSPAFAEAASRRQAPGEGKFSFLRNRQSLSVEQRVMLKPYYL
jgi:hypothetical protein